MCAAGLRWRPPEAAREAAREAGDLKYSVWINNPTTQIRFEFLVLLFFGGFF